MILSLAMLSLAGVLFALCLASIRFFDKL